MARYGSEHKEATRRRIVEAAGRRFKRDGIDGSGIATLMADAGLTNLKGHRLAGGIRASLYNAQPKEAAQALANFMTVFAARHG